MAALALLVWQKDTVYAGLRRMLRLGPGVAVYLLYRDNPQDEAWLARSAGAAGKALAQGLGSLDG